MSKIEATPEQIETIKNVMRKLAWECFAIGMAAGIFIGKVIL